MSTPITWRPAPRTHTHDPSDVTGLPARLSTLEYDSGWRDITALLGEQYISGQLWLRRTGPQVWLHFYQLSLKWVSGSSITLAYQIPAGFRPSTQYANLPFAGRSASYAAGPMRVSRYGVADIYGFADGLLIDASTSFHTADTPTAHANLPGVAVSL